MDLDDYLVAGESAEHRTRVTRSGGMTEYSEGTIACTPRRVVYAGDDEVVDVSTNAIDAVEYHGLSYPKWALYSGIPLLGLGALLLAAPVATGLPTLHAPATLLGLLGLGVLVAGYFLKQSVLELHTASKSYRFVARNRPLSEIVHAVREYER